MADSIYGEDDAETTRSVDFDALDLDVELARATAPVLIVIRGVLAGKRFTLRGQPRFVLGRDLSADVQLDDANVSRQHLQVTLEGERIFITDLGSRNGTFLNNEALGPGKVELAKEDMIRLGSTVLKYLPAGQFETLYHINMADAAHQDKLTGLFNRKYMSDVVEVQFKRVKALRRSMSILFFDIDDLKRINDTFGHDCGDRALSAVGAVVKASGLREGDLAGRYGGDEFLIVLASLGPELAAKVGERIRQRIEDYVFIYDGQTIPITVSMGVASVDDELRTATELYRAADTALYESKRNGRNQVTVASR
jgi:diguanylate cyclase (GGDEF)-like protein